MARNRCVPADGLFLEFAFELVDLPFQGVDRFVDRLFESPRTVAGYQILARHAERDGRYFVALILILVEFQNDFRSRRTVGEPVQFGHFRLYEFDQLPVGVEFHGLNLYVHSVNY